MVAEVSAGKRLKRSLGSEVRPDRSSTKKPDAPLQEVHQSPPQTDAVVNVIFVENKPTGSEVMRFSDWIRKDVRAGSDAKRPDEREVSAFL